MNRLFLLFFSILTLTLTGCIEDSFDTSPQAQPAFSVEELDMGTQFAENPSPTAKLMIYNRNSKLISLSSVRMRSGKHFRLNVDGLSGREFHDVEIRPNDSIYVFVECTMPQVDTDEPQWIADDLEVITNGVTKLLPVKALAQNVERHLRQIISANTIFSARLPHLIADTLTVAAGATLTLEPGARLLFHDKGALVVEGSLVSQGTAEAPVTMRGDRTGNVVADIDFNVMSNQWEGVYFAPESRGELSHTEIMNTRQGVFLDSLVNLTLVNSRLYNSGTTQLIARGGSKVTALGCEISNAASALLLLEGGEYLFNRCTIANWYLFKWPDMAIIEFMDAANTHADFSNSIIYGRDSAVGDYDNPEEVDIWFRRCMFKSGGNDDARYLQCLWEQDPALDYSLTEYTFDYSPMPSSPALEAALAEYDNPQLPECDSRGRRRGLTLGAYAPAPPTQEAGAGE